MDDDKDCISYLTVASQKVAAKTQGETVRLVRTQKIPLVKLCQGLGEELRWMAGVEDATADLLQVGDLGVHLIHGDGRIH